MASEVATTDIGTLFLATVLIHYYWKKKLAISLLNLLILNIVTYFTTSLSNIDGVKWESAALGISNSSSLSEMFLKKKGEQQSRTKNEENSPLEHLISWCSFTSLLQFTQTLLRACFILLLTYKNICTKLITVYGLGKLMTDFSQNSILIFFNLFTIMDPV